jgi:hypothetical protein
MSIDRTSIPFPATFPLVISPPPPLPDLACGDWSAIEDVRRIRMHDFYLPYWQQLSQTYVAALAGPHTDDPGLLEVVVEDWPGTFEAQQTSLNVLLEISKLRQAWRSQANWQLAQRPYMTDGQRQVLVELEREHREGSRPLAEIPLYHGFIRSSCQQLICLPLAEWAAMYSDSTWYEPGKVDQTVVSRLAHRIAQVFNAPPQSPEQFAQVPSQYGNIVWNSSLCGLTSSIDSHGMSDRLFDDYGRPIERDPENVPGWRFDGFCGQLRVIQEDGSQWYVTVLAPAHFIGNLMGMARESQIRDELG